MGKIVCFSAIVAMTLATSRLNAQVATPDPDVRGPARRAAGAAAEGLGAPGVENRIENRQQRRDLRNADVNPNAAARANARIADADRWRYVHHNNQWWYYSPQKSWLIYRNNNWGPFVPGVQYSTGYRGMTNDGYYTRRGVLGRRTYVSPTPNRATRAGANIGADVGAAAGGAPGAQRGSSLGAAVGETVDAARGTLELPPPVPQTTTPPAIPVPNP